LVHAEPRPQRCAAPIHPRRATFVSRPTRRLADEQYTRASRGRHQWPCAERQTVLANTTPTYILENGQYRGVGPTFQRVSLDRIQSGGSLS
jgi:hypothetical protein